MVFKEVESDRFWWREGQCQGGEKWFNGSRADRGLAPRTLSHSMFQGSWRSEPLLKKMVEKARKFLLSSCEYDVSRLYPVLSSIFCWTLWHNFPVRVLERIHEKVQIHVLQYKIGRPCHTSNKYLNCVILHLCYFTSLCYFTLYNPTKCKYLHAHSIVEETEARRGKGIKLKSHSQEVLKAD